MAKISWHVYDGVAQGEHYILVVVGPASPGESRSDGEPWDSPMVTAIDGDPVILNHRAEFDHEPTDTEQLELVPDEYRQKFIEWQTDQLVASQTPLDEDEEPFELDEEEKVALALALSSRVEQLAGARDRSLVRQADIRLVDACEAQISALSRIYERLGLTARSWNF